jgi:hypothetical protein
MGGGRVEHHIRTFGGRQRGETVPPNSFADRNIAARTGVKLREPSGRSHGAIHSPFAQEGMFGVRALFGGFFAAVLAASAAHAQVTTPTDTLRDDLPRVFLDCNASGCDDDYLRVELTWLNFVRDRTLAQVHILATSQQTASGGAEITVAFIGLGPNSARQDTIVAISQQSDVQDERRQLIRRIISQGMMRFVANTPLASRLSVNYRAPAAGAEVSATRGARDRWNLWVFRIGGNTFFNGEETYKYYQVRGYVEASRITAAFKTQLGVSYYQSRELFKYDTSTTGTPAPLFEEVAKRRESNGMRSSRRASTITGPPACRLTPRHRYGPTWISGHASAPPSNMTCSRTVNRRGGN